MNSVKDLKFNELPEDLRDNVIKAAHIIKKKVIESMDSEDASQIRKNEWGYDKVREFLVWFQDGVGNARVYKRGKNYSCMIQITGHVDHIEEDPHCEIFRKMINRAFSKCRSECKKLGFTVVSEGECGEPFEGFDLWTTSTVAKELWEKFSDKEEKTLHEIKESIDPVDIGIGMASGGTMTDVAVGSAVGKAAGIPTSSAVIIASKLRQNKSQTNNKADIPPKEKDDLIDSPPEVEVKEGDKVSLGIQELPKHLQEVIEYTNFLLRDFTESALKYFSEKYDFGDTSDLLNTIGGFTEDSNCIGDTILWKENGIFIGSTTLTPPIPITSWEVDGLLESVSQRFNEAFEGLYPTKHITVVGDNSYAQFEMAYDSDYTRILWNKIESNPMVETAVVFPRRKFIQESTEFIFEPFLEGKDSNISVVKDLMTPVLQDKSMDKKKVVKTLNTVAQIINKGSIQSWGGGWKDISIKLLPEDVKGSPVFKFQVPKEIYSKDFAGRFIRGHESFHGFQHRNPTVSIELNMAAIRTMKSPGDFYTALKAAVQHYSKGIDKLANKIQGEFIEFHEEFKKMVLDSNLYKIVGIALEQLYLFEKVDLSDPKSMFSIPKKSVDSALVVIRGLPKKSIQGKDDQAKIVKDFESIFKSYTECGSDNYNHSDFIESLQKLMDGSYDEKMNYYREYHRESQVNMDWITNQKDPELRYYQEFFGVKKLKKIPRDIVAYISVETDSIADANDKMMIASYCLSKLEIVEWYIELLEVGSKKYVVPHTLPELNTMRTQLLACYDRIMRVKITPIAQRPIIGEIRYPKGYEG